MQLVMELIASAAVLALAGYAVWKSGYQCGKMRQRQEEENQAEQETEILMRAAREANRDEI